MTASDRLEAAWGAAAADPLLFAALAIGALAIALIAGAGRAAARKRDAALREIAAAQQALAGGLRQAAEAQAHAQGETLRLVEARMDAVTTRLGEATARAQSETVATVERRLDHVLDGLGKRVSEANDRVAATAAEAARALETRLEQSQSRLSDALTGSAERTAASLGDLQRRLEAIDQAQANIEKLSGDVLGLQDLLANKQARGAFGEIQLNDLIVNALPPDAYAFQVTLSNGRRVDALLRLPHPPGPMAVDAKFPLESFEALRAAEDPTARDGAARAFAAAVRTHIRAVAERYVVAGETADGALMFLPSEAIYAELHARFPDVVREGFRAGVWIVSPTTLMATLNTMRAVLKDAKIRAEADDMRREIGLLARDVERLAQRAGALQGHFAKVEKDLREIDVSARRSLARARRLDGAEGGAELTLSSDAAPLTDVRESDGGGRNGAS